MAEVQLADNLYRQAERRAAEEGFSSVEAFVENLLSEEFETAEASLDHLFTPERLSKIDLAVKEIEDGQFITAEQVRDHFETKFPR